MKVELVVFDLAGTTVKDNKDVHRILKDALHHYGVEISFDDANEVMGIPKPVAIRRLLESNYNGEWPVTQEWIDEIHLDFIQRMVLFYQNDPFVEEKEGVSETFSLLKSKGLKIFVDTGFDRTITDAVLGRMRWSQAGLIDGSVASDEVAHGRPYPDLIFRAMALSGVTTAKAVAKVGDTTSDLLQGYNAGCGYVIGVTTGAHSHEKLASEYHTHLVRTTEQVPPILLHY